MKALHALRQALSGRTSQRRRAGLTATTLALMLAAAVAGPAGAGSASAATPYCGITWGSLAKSGGSLGTAPMIASRTGQHACWDRVVFEFAGSATGYRVSYASEVYTQAGQPMASRTAGGALINVTLLESASTYPHATFDHVANVSGYRTLRDVVYGGSFEGYTTFAVGVRARLPMRVFVLAGPGTHSRIVIDVAHAWAQ